MGNGDVRLLIQLGAIDRKVIRSIATVLNGYLGRAVRLGVVLFREEGGGMVLNEYQWLCLGITMCLGFHDLGNGGLDNKHLGIGWNWRTWL